MYKDMVRLVAMQGYTTSCGQWFEGQDRQKACKQAGQGNEENGEKRRQMLWKGSAGNGDQKGSGRLTGLCLGLGF